jgi:hypothetical protein
MLRLKIGGAEKNTVEVYLVEREDGSIDLQDAHSGFVIVGLRVVDEKINLVRYSGLEDTNYNTDKAGRVKETEE